MVARKTLQAMVEIVRITPKSAIKVVQNDARVRLKVGAETASQLALLFIPVRNRNWSFIDL